jgi:hypothetical protein
MNEPAFPIVGNDSSRLLESYGMTLRDYFAAHAMQGLIDYGYGTSEKLSEKAYAMASAMMKAREAQDV